MDGKVMAMTFEEKLEWGKKAEKEVENELYANGYSIIRSYDYNGDDNKSPRMFSIADDNVLPDLDCSKNGERYWIEVKRYSTSPINRALGEKVHGLKRRLYNDYIIVENKTGNKVFLVICEEDTGIILKARLKALTKYDCMCSSCKNGNHNNCKAPIKDSVYFLRKEFKIMDKI
jgi:hypothetical protein